MIEETVGVALVSGLVLGGQDDGVAGEAVAEGVELGALFGGVGAGPLDFWALACS